MRKMITLILTLVLLLVLPLSAPATPGSAYTPPPENVAVFTIGSTTYTVNGVPQQMDVAPVIVNGRTLMPVRYLAYSLGIPESGVIYKAQSDFDPAYSDVIIKRDRASGNGLNVVVFYKPDMSNTGLEPLGDYGPIVRFDVPPEMLPPGRLMIPYRYVAQALGAIVSWNGDTRQVTVKTWQTLPAVPSGLTANQVSMQLGGNTITATENGTHVGQWTYPYPVDVANPYYPGTNESPHLVAIVPTLEAAGVPAQNILWDPDSQTLMVAGNKPDQFLYLIPGSNTNAINEFATKAGTDNPYSVVVENGTIYGDNIIGALLANSFNIYCGWNDSAYAQSHNGINIQS